MTGSLHFYIIFGEQRICFNKLTGMQLCQGWSVAKSSRMELSENFFSCEVSPKIKVFFSQIAPSNQCVEQVDPSPGLDGIQELTG